MKTKKLSGYYPEPVARGGHQVLHRRPQDTSPVAADAGLLRGRSQERRDGLSDLLRPQVERHRLPGFQRRPGHLQEGREGLRQLRLQEGRRGGGILMDLVEI